MILPEDTDTKAIPPDPSLDPRQQIDYIPHASLPAHRHHPPSPTSNYPEPPRSPFSRHEEAYGIRLDALDADADDEDGVGEVLPPYTRSGTRSSRRAGRLLERGELEVEMEDDEHEGWDGYRNWRRYLGMDGTKSGRRRQGLILRGGALVSVIYFIGFLMLPVLLPRPPPPPPPGGPKPHLLPESEGDVLYCLTLAEDDSTYLNENYRSLSSTVYLPLDAALTFLHVNGPYSAGNVDIMSYTPTETDLNLASSSLGVKCVNPIKVEIEAVYYSEGDWQGESRSKREDYSEQGSYSDAWTELEQTSMCVMKKGIDEDGPGKPDDDERMIKRSLWDHLPAWLTGKKKDEAGLGLTIWTRSSLNDTYYQNATTPTDVNFRIQMQVPTSATQQIIRHLDIASVWMDYSISDLDANTKFDRLRLHSSLGDMQLDSVTANTLVAESAASITLRAMIGEKLDVHAMEGRISAAIDLIPRIGDGPKEDAAGCGLPNWDVVARIVRGNLDINISGWDQYCRSLHLDAVTEIGNLQVRSHENFEGDWRTSGHTDLVIRPSDTLEDPTGSLGRERVVNVTTNEDVVPIGAQISSGDVNWVPATLSEGRHRGKKSSMKLKSILGTIKLTL